MNLSDFRALECFIMPKIAPKFTKVGPKNTKNGLLTVESVIEVGLVFNFWILGADFYSSFYQFLLNKCSHFKEFLRFLLSHSFIRVTLLKCI